MRVGTDRDLVKELAFEIIRRAAPDERRMFELQCDAYFADPRRALRQDRERADLLGIGVTEVLVPILTPLALAVSAEVTQYLATQVVRPALAKAGASASQAVRALLRRTPADAPAPTTPVLELAPDERARVRVVVVDVVTRHGRPESLAQLIADAVASGSADDD